MLNHIEKFIKEKNENGIRSALKKLYNFIYYKIFRRLPASVFIPSKMAEIRHDPLISVIVVSYNSIEDIPACLNSINSQFYNKIELIFIENGIENTEKLVKSIVPEATWIRNDSNTGFAEGNNIGFDYAKGEFIALVNPDARLDPECILELISPFRFDGNVAVSVPKIRFWTRFVDYHYESKTSFKIDTSMFDSQLNYSKYFIRQGKFDHRQGIIHSLMRLSQDNIEQHEISIRLPLDNVALKLCIVSEASIKVSVHGRDQIFYDSVDGIVHMDLSLFETDHPSAGWIINNAGSGVTSEGPFDIGFGEKDEIFYDQRHNVAAMCGCVALVSRMALIGRPIFRPEFFAYFEDSELSHYLQAQGFKIQYNPRAVAYHKHSASSSEGSIVWNSLVKRSRIIYNSYILAKDADIRLKAYLEDKNRYEALPATLADTLAQYDRVIGPTAPSGRSIGVYNSYWKTLGGGEAHALTITMAMAAPNDEIYLISETDFDIDQLEKHFKINLKKARKLVQSRVTTSTTGYFDIFINATFKSNLISKAKKSYFIVSFPHQNFDREALKGYTFLFNSRFTEEWSTKFWGPVTGLIVYPTFAVTVPPANEPMRKQKVITSLGRITPRGHKKNQHSIIKAFISILEENQYRDWYLYIVGSFDESNVEDKEYLKYIRKIAAAEKRVVIKPNCPRGEVDRILKETSIYTHAAGLNVPEDQPEYHEHFGIAVMEACVNGALPVVYHRGGPAEIVYALNAGMTYSSIVELSKVLLNAMRNAEHIDHSKIALSARQFCELSNKKSLEVLADINH